MDPTSAPVNPAELYELLGIVGGVIASGLLGFLLVRRARASRQRMIDAVGEAPAPRLRDPKARKLAAAEEPEEDLEEEPEGEPEEAAPEPVSPWGSSPPPKEEPRRRRRATRGKDKPG